MKRSIFVAALVLSGTSCSHLGRLGESPLRVMTYNIRSGNGDIATTARTIASFSPDIVALQEVDVHWATRSDFADQASELGDRLHMQVRFAHIYDLPPEQRGTQRREFGVALLTRFPIVSWNNRVITRLSTQEQAPVPTPMPGFLDARVNVRGTVIEVFDTHLDYRSDPRVRAQQVRDMLAYVDSADMPKILMGDLNAGPDATELRPLRAALHDVWSDALGPGFTYPAEAPLKRIDFVLVSDHFRVRSASVPNTHASDHRPVVADIVLRR